MTNVYIDTEAGRRLIGNFEGGTFTSKRQSSKHLFKQLNAWGLDIKAYDGMVKDHKLKTVKIIDIDTQITYTTEAENFKKHGTILRFKTHRTQVFLPLDFWKKG